MMTMCPSCFELYSDLWSKLCCNCGHKSISLSVELINLVQLFINRGFKVISASCSTYVDQEASGKNTHIRIDFGANYPKAIFGELPPDWIISEFNLTKDNKILQPPLTMLSCICRHPPSESDMTSIEFEKSLTISNLEIIVEDKDPQASRAILTLLELM